MSNSDFHLLICAILLLPVGVALACATLDLPRRYWQEAVWERGGAYWLMVTVSALLYWVAGALLPTWRVWVYEACGGITSWAVKIRP